MRVMKTEAQLMTVSQVARRLNLSSERIRQLARAGRLPPDQETELGRLWLPATVERFATARHSERLLDPTDSEEAGFDDGCPH